MNYDVIKNYLEGKTTETESEQIRKWLKNPNNDHESRKILGDIWASSDIKLRGSVPNFNLMLDKMHHNIKRQKNNSSIQKAYSDKRFSRFYNTFSKVAAILILPLLLASLYFYINPKQDVVQVASTSTREIYTKPGTRTKLELSDGTLVWLNDGTTFRYPEQFAGSNREVYVDGEAYFEVKSDPNNPFIVDNPMLTEDRSLRYATISTISLFNNGSPVPCSHTMC